MLMLRPSKRFSGSSVCDSEMANLLYTLNLFINSFLFSLPPLLMQQRVHEKQCKCGEKSKCSSCALWYQRKITTQESSQIYLHEFFVHRELLLNIKSIIFKTIEERSKHQCTNNLPPLVMSDGPYVWHKHHLAFVYITFLTSHVLLFSIQNSVITQTCCVNSFKTLPPNIPLYDLWFVEMLQSRDSTFTGSCHQHFICKWMV
jgi:hypothetical protein